ncbi:AAA family ATPase [Sphingobium sp. RSMS]|uniref:AAA family ATPase n=1 Tax=Sphingobium sp. RSMS TaxID=520734 RepID=UPI0010F96548|nr:AAA family ATPase [Sphingobium sp. RSMS]UXC92199.1 AAA family ATPase [Sphingobium sp. RSMS]
MQIEYIRIENWRSFYGENSFLVSTDPERNVTLIRAENGVGKTSLLAAINWCFFDILPAPSEFEDPERLVNKFAAQKDGATTTTVEIDFRHEGRTYRASRTYDQPRRETKPLRLSEIDNGAEVPSAKDRPDRFINSVIPKEMAPHFFFYGEATSRYTGASGAKKFGEAVKGILGSTVARMALDDLSKVMGDYKRQASDNTSEDAQAAEAAIEKTDARISQYREQITKFEQEIETAEDRIQRLNQELAGAKPAKEAQARRARIEADIRQKEAEKAKAAQRADSWMRTFATSVLAEELVAEAGNVIRNEDTRGRLPAPYDQKFVDELLEDEMCVCGRPIAQGSPEYEKIKALLETAGDQVVMSRVMTTSTALGTLVEKSKRAWSDFERNQEDLRRLEGEIQRLDADLQEISKELASNPIDDIAAKEASRERAKEQKRQAERQRNDCQGSIIAFERQKKDFESQRDQLVQKSEAAKRYVRRAQLAAALTTRLQGRLQQEEEAARASIEKEIDGIVQSVMRKSVKVTLDKNYQLKLTDERGTEAAKSTGENQLLGLAFTGAIAKYAKERADLVDDILLPGTVAPLVVDSPFGHLDPVYRRGVAEFLPKLASQVILFVSTSQASDVVMEMLGPKIQHEYVLTRHNQIDGAGKPREDIVINGKTYDLTIYNSDIDGTKITEVM